MIIRLFHPDDSISNDQYKKFTKDEFYAYVNSLASKMGIEKDLSPYIEIVETQHDTAIGECCGHLLGEKWLFSKLSFADQILDGKTYTLLQINDIVKHELCHLIANSIKGIECGHDVFWQSICKEYNYSPSKSLPILHYSLSLGSEIISDNKPEYKYILRCNKCKRIYRKCDSFDLELFQHFILCTCGLDMTYDDLPAQTNCCRATYCYEADAEELNASLEKENSWPQIQKIIQREIDNYTNKK